MAAFAMFSLTAPSLLAFDQERAEGKGHTIYGSERVPCDTPRRDILDLVSPKWLRPLCKSVLRQRQRGKAGGHFSAGRAGIATKMRDAFGFLTPRVSKETDARCYAFTTAYATMIQLCNVF